MAFNQWLIKEGAEIDFAIDCEGECFCYGFDQGLLEGLVVEGFREGRLVDRTLQEESITSAFKGGARNFLPVRRE